jgi:chromosome segregation ATPase
MTEIVAALAELRQVAADLRSTVGELKDQQAQLRQQQENLALQQARFDAREAARIQTCQAHAKNFGELFPRVAAVEQDIAVLKSEKATEKEYAHEDTEKKITWFNGAALIVGAIVGAIATVVFTKWFLTP